LATVGDIISISPRGRFLAQLNMNVFWYQIVVWAGAATITNALGQFAVQVGTPMRALQHSALLYFELEWKNWSNPAELVRSPYDVTGSGAGEAMAPANAGKYRFFGFSAATRSGWKRPGCLLEADVSSGVVQSAAFARWDAFRDGCKSILEPAPSSTIFRLAPVIVGTAADGSKDLARINPIANVEYDLNSTSQTSRKVGRGA
jgi:hypothetical protein